MNAPAPGNAEAEAASRDRREIDVIEGMSEGFLALDGDYRLTYINKAGEKMFGQPREELLGRDLWSTFALSSTNAEPAYRRAMEQRIATRFEIFYEPWQRWFEANIDPTSNGGLAVYFRDISHRKKNETILNGQKRAFELAVNGAPLQQILDVLVSTIEQFASDGVMASVLLLDADGVHVHVGSAPHLPPAYSRALEGLPIGPTAGSCGTAAYTKQRVVVADIATDPLWDDYRAFAQPHGLRACWSTPILSPTGEVLGTFALYHPRVFAPRNEDLEIVDLLTHTASVVIERYREVERRAEAEKQLAVQIDGLERLHALALKLAHTPSLRDKLDAIVQTAAEIHETSRGLLCVYRADGREIEACSSIGLDKELVASLVQRDDAVAPSRHSFARKTRIVVEDIETDDRFEAVRDVARTAGFRSVHTTPITMRSGEVIGVLSLHFTAPRKPTQLQMRLADLCAAHAADAVDAARSEEALRQSEEQFRHLADNMSQFAWMADGNGSLFWYNERWFEFTGTTLDDMQGWGWTKVHHPDHVDRVVKKIEDAFKTGQAWEDTFPLRGKDGTYRWFLSRAVPLRDTSGRVVRWFGTNTDITAVREAEMKLQQAKEAAEEANRAKDQFLAMLGHELRNPLAPIVTALELAKSHDEDHSGEIAVMERQVQHLVRLVEDILDIARFTRGKVTIVRERIELSAVVRRALEMSMPLIGEKHHQLQVDVPEEGLAVNGDPVRLAQIVSNLVSNAAKYTNPNGRISIHAGREEGTIVFRVKDNGIGLSPDALKSIFDEFVQESEALKSARGGLGLGLAIVKKLVQLHGGTVEAHSEGRGRGSEFVVRLPPATGTPAEAQPALRTEPVAAAQPRRILIVDDNEDAAALLEQTLRRMGYVVAVAYDGAAALDTAADFQPEVALIDLNLPKISGYDLPPLLRSVPGLANLRLVAATGHGEESVRDRTREAQFDAHLVKPIGIRTLARTLDELLQ